MSWSPGIRKQDIGTDQDLLNKWCRQSKNMSFVVRCSMRKGTEKAGDGPAKPARAGRFHDVGKSGVE